MAAAGVSGQDETARTRLRIVGMNCPRCAGDLRRRLADLPGVTSVDIHAEHGGATVTHAASVSREMLLETVESAGHDAV